MVAFVIDIGATMLDRQRLQTAVDLAAIQGSEELRQGILGLSDSQYTQTASTRARNTVLGNIAANRFYDSTTVQNKILPFIDFREKQDSDQRGVEVSYSQAFRSYFSSAFGVGRENKLQVTGSSLFLEEQRSDPIHLILLYESTIENMLPMGPDCLDEVSEGWYPSLEDIKSFVSPDCPSRLSQMSAFTKHILELLTPADRISLVRYNRVATFGSLGVPVTEDTLKDIHHEIDSFEQVRLQATDYDSDLDIRIPSSSLASALLGIERMMGKREIDSLSGMKTVAVLLTNGAPSFRHTKWSYEQNDHPDRIGDPAKSVRYGYYESGWFEKENELCSEWVDDPHNDQDTPFCRKAESSDEMLVLPEEQDSMQLAIGLTSKDGPISELNVVGFGVSDTPVTVEFSDIRSKGGYLSGIAIHRYASGILSMPNRARNVLRSIANDTSSAYPDPYNNLNNTVSGRNPNSSGRYYEADRNQNFSFASDLINRSRRGLERSHQVHLVSQVSE